MSTIFKTKMLIKIKAYQLFAGYQMCPYFLKSKGFKRGTSTKLNKNISQVASLALAEMGTSKSITSNSFSNEINI